MKTYSWSSLLLLAVAVPALAELKSSRDGTCGPNTGNTCSLSFYGGCCGADGKCGATADKCGAGCQSGFGYCSGSSNDEREALFDNTIPGDKSIVARQSSLCPSYDGKTYTGTCGATYVIECGLNRPGYDLTFPRSAGSLNACIDSCTATKGCASVVWDNARLGPKYCWLKSKSGFSIKDSSSWGARKLTGCAAPPSSSKIASSTSSLVPAISPILSSTTSSAPVVVSSSSSISIVVFSSSARSIVLSSSSSVITSAIIPSSSSSSKSSSVSVSSTGSFSVSATKSSSISSSAVVSSSKSSSIVVSPIFTSSSSSARSFANSSSSASSASVSSSQSSSVVVSSSSLSVSSSASLTSSSRSSIITSSSSNRLNISSTVSTLSTVSTSASRSSSSSIVSSSTTCDTVPAPTGKLPNCKRCDGQPGKDTFCGYSANTNSYTHTPKTCKVINYTFDITNTTKSPDGVKRLVMLVNGKMPGPPIKASWGDTVVVTVNNKLQNNGTSIHFHGIRQLNNNMNDGVPSITQCPIAPGQSMTYTWVAENYGTSWYHSHFAIQAWEGVMGPIIIDGPQTADYDVDAGVFQIQDWSHFTVDSRYDRAQDATLGGPVRLDTGLINGKNIWLGDAQDPTKFKAVGKRYDLSTDGPGGGIRFSPGKKYLLHVINSGIQSTYKFYLDGHSFTVIANDFVPIVPYKTNILNINIGQRYDIIVEADQPVGNYFLRADNQEACSSTVQGKNIRAIIRYEGSDASADPTSTAYTYTEECVDEPLASLVPFAKLNAGAVDVTATGAPLDVIVRANNVNLFKWFLSGTTFQSQYGDPTLLDIYNTNTVPTYSGNLLVNLPTAGQMVYVIIQSPIPLPHPIHLHGHDFWILASGPGTYDSSKLLNLNNPTRRDTALMPAAGYLVLAFETDNPGAWLMHCHIGWHTSMGFALQFVELQDRIKSSGAVNNSCTLAGTCASWNTYAAANGVTVLDSGV
ncbi:hypothetical protein EJ08DRAFT_451466 [Tothia fuscella]|uniref:Chitin-binding type-1 domain-containing protein n=1 Tax=Tothia fuscella TaxID=1048955 RepID=A0A9P4TV50_9PEZI|nr:hypothetical protein EJ08DRAFT_451466 [Tothia fuscella]